MFYFSFLDHLAIPFFVFSPLCALSFLFFNLAFLHLGGFDSCVFFFFLRKNNFSLFFFFFFCFFYFRYHLLFCLVTILPSIFFVLTCHLFFYTLCPHSHLSF